MPNYFKIPLLNPFKFVPVTGTPGIHFDDDWAYKQIRTYEMQVRYKQKWNKADTTKLQLESSLAPSDLVILDKDGISAKTIPWVNVFSYINFSIYEVVFDISDLPEGTYFIYQVVTLLAVTFEAISEPILSRVSHENTTWIKYKNSFNDFDVAFTTGIEFMFRGEFGVVDFTPGMDRSVYVNQIGDVNTLKGYPGREFKFAVGDAPGVAPYVVDILNRIFHCDSINNQGLFIQGASNAKWDVNRVKGYPWIGASLDIVPARNTSSLELVDITPLIGSGIVTAYNIETDFFGPGAIIPVTEVEQDG